MDDTKPRCWAFNLHRQRCDRDAGHTGEHYAAFTDEEAMEALNGVTVAPLPTVPALTVVPDTGTVLRMTESGIPVIQGLTAPPEPEERKPTCMSCQHAYQRHSQDGCSAKTQNPDDTIDPCSCLLYVG